jgi:site-specific recombinase XerD
VFSNAAGGPLNSWVVTRTLHSILASAGLRQQRFPDLRHAFATLQLEAGAELFEVSRALGHTDIGTTANVYAHFTEAMAGRMADRMTGILDSGAGAKKVRELTASYGTVAASGTR